MFIAGYVFAFIAVILANMVFQSQAGMLAVFLIVLASLPILYTTIKNEEEIDMKFDSEIKLLKEHTKVLVFLIFFFLGITSAIATTYLVLPEASVNTIYSTQHQAIQGVSSAVSGKVVAFDHFVNVFFNNMKVLFFCLVFSFLYGSGALFILTWNASVVGAASGNLIKQQLANVASLAGMSGISAYFGAISLSFIRYMIHGIMEMAAYFIAGLAGGIVSIALIKHNLREEKVLIDALDLVLISISILFAAAYVEVYWTKSIVEAFLPLLGS